MGPERAKEFGKRNGVPGELVVRIRPTKVLATFDMTGWPAYPADPAARGAEFHGQAAVQVQPAANRTIVDSGPGIPHPAGKSGNGSSTAPSPGGSARRCSRWT